MRAQRRTIIEYVTPRSGKTPEEAVAEKLCDFSFVQLVEEPESEPPMPKAEGVRITPLTCASDELLFGLPKGSALAERSEASLAELRHETFFLLARKSSEPLKTTFAAACRRRGFRPAMKMISSERYEEFYLLEHGDGVHVLAACDLKADATFARQLERRMAVVPASEPDGLHLRWHVLHRDPGRNDVFARFLALLVAGEPALA